MSSSRFIYDAEGDIIREVHFEDRDDFSSLVGIRTIQNLDPVMEEVRLQRDLQAAQPKPKGMRLAAVIPVSLIENMFRDGSIHDPKALKRLLNDPQMAPFKIREGSRH